MATKNQIDVSQLLSGNRRSLAKAITLIESNLALHQERAQKLLEDILEHTGNSVRIGITGSPGVGKSTFIEAFGLMLIELGLKVAVLAVDPSSPKTGGSILGDKTRMEYLSREQNAFIRPSPSGDSLGGVAYKTRETMYLCEAAKFDVVLVETVGVGQSEYQVASMVDFFLVLINPNTGDELQGIKKGIIEMADAIVINKADTNMQIAAQSTQRFYQNALNLLYSSKKEAPPVLTCSALNNTNLDGVWKYVSEAAALKKQTGYFNTKRASQNRNWMQQLVTQLFNDKCARQTDIAHEKLQLEKSVDEGKITAIKAAKRYVDITIKSFTVR